MDPWGHSLVRLVQDYPETDLKDGLTGLIAHAKKLDKLYILIRYPNGLPDLTPAEVFTEEEGEQAIESAKTIIDFAEGVLSSP